MCDRYEDDDRDGLGEVRCRAVCRRAETIRRPSDDPTAGGGWRAAILCGSGYRTMNSVAAGASLSIVSGSDMAKTGRCAVVS